RLRVRPVCPYTEDAAGRLALDPEDPGRAPDVQNARRTLSAPGGVEARRTPRSRVPGGDASRSPRRSGLPRHRTTDPSRTPGRTGPRAGGRPGGAGWLS